MAAPKRIKKKEHEKLTDANIAYVIGLLGQDKPITKKEACAVLNISYNTTRLNTIIENYVTRKENEKRRRDANKGKPATEDEISSIITGYLEGETVTDIANQLFRSSTFVKAIIERLGVPQKQLGEAKYETAILPDECVEEDFIPGQVAWSAKYHSPCEIIEEIPGTKYSEKYGCKVYKVYILQSLDEVPQFYPNISIGGFHAAAPAYDLGSLEHLAKYNAKYNY